MTALPSALKKQPNYRLPAAGILTTGLLVAAGTTVYLIFRSRSGKSKTIKGESEKRNILGDRVALDERGNSANELIQPEDGNTVPVPQEEPCMPSSPEQPTSAPEYTSPESSHVPIIPQCSLEPLINQSLQEPITEQVMTASTGSELDAQTNTVEPVIPNDALVTSSLSIPTPTVAASISESSDDEHDGENAGFQGEKESILQKSIEEEAAPIAENSEDSYYYYYYDSAEGEQPANGVDDQKEKAAESDSREDANDATSEASSDNSTPESNELPNSNNDVDEEDSLYSCDDEDVNDEEVDDEEVVTVKAQEQLNVEPSKDNAPQQANEEPSIISDDQSLGSESNDEKVVVGNEQASNEESSGSAEDDEEELDEQQANEESSKSTSAEDEESSEQDSEDANPDTEPESNAAASESAEEDKKTSPPRALLLARKQVRTSNLNSILDRMKERQAARTATKTPVARKLFT